VAVYVCTDWKRHGHASRYADTLPGTSGRVSGPMTEQDKAARREVIANNKAWESAEVVRRKWLRTFLSRKAAPKDAPQWITATLACCSHDVRRAMEDGHPMALELLGLTADQTWTPYSGRSHPVADAAEKATPARATMLTLALLLAGLEATTGRHTWRAPISSTHRSYFAALARWGCPLSDVEQIVVQPEPDSGADADIDPDPGPDDAPGGAAAGEQVDGGAETPATPGASE
jgi:ParB family chromosome partitioning protein